jgi:hypothetical protein
VSVLLDLVGVYVLTIAAEVIVDPSVPLWEQWLSPTAIERLVQFGGLGFLAWLFATGRIITNKQHEARVADLMKYADAEKVASDANHARELAQAEARRIEMMREKDVRFDGMKESRDSWRDLARNANSRADLATNQLMESNEVVGLAVQQIQALEAAVGAATPDSSTATPPGEGT